MIIELQPVGLNWIPELTDEYRKQEMSCQFLNY